MNNNDTNPASLVELPSIKGKGKATGHNHGNSTPGPSCLPGGRKLPTLAPKFAITTPETPGVTERDNIRKRSRMDEYPHSSQLFHPTPHTTDTMSPMNGTGSGSRIDNNFLEFDGSIGGSNLRYMMNDVQPSENHIYALATPLDLSGIQNQSRMEIARSLRFPNALTSQPPTMMSQIPPVSRSALKICAGCDARLVTLRNHIRAIPDAAIVMQLLEDYFGLRDNWHGCQQGFGGLDG